MTWRDLQTRYARFTERMSTRRLIITLAVVSVLGSIPLLSLWQVALSTGNEVRTIKNVAYLAPSPVTALFSARRVPQTLVDQVKSSRLTSKLDQLTTLLPPESCLVVTTDGRIVYQLRPNLSLIPASTMKLLTAAVALDVLGAQTTYITRLVGIVAGSEVRGDLWLVGSGDPLLSTRLYPTGENYPTLFPTYIESLVDALVAKGITMIQGGVVGDDSLYDRERYSPTWGDGLRSVEVGPIGALMINDATVLGTPLKPANPAYAAAAEFSRLLIERGILVKDPPDVGIASSDTPLIASLESAPIKNIVSEMLTNSDNNTAELLLKDIGRVARGSATRIDGLRVVAEKITQWGLPTQGVVLSDGSGLDRANRVTCSLLTAVLEQAGAESDLILGMAIAGSTGTLRDVFLSGPGYGVMRAKTGTLNGIKALSGFLPLGDTHASVFTLILNGPGTSTVSFYRPIWNGLVTALATGAQTIDVSLVEPLTPHSAP